MQEAATCRNPPLPPAPKQNTEKPPSRPTPVTTLENFPHPPETKQLNPSQPLPTRAVFLTSRGRVGLGSVALPSRPSQQPGPAGQSSDKSPFRQREIHGTHGVDSVPGRFFFPARAIFLVLASLPESSDRQPGSRPRRPAEGLFFLNPNFRSTLIWTGIANIASTATRMVAPDAGTNQGTNRGTNQRANASRPPATPWTLPLRDSPAWSEM